MVYKDHYVFVDEQRHGLYSIIHVCQEDISNRVSYGLIEDCLLHIDCL